MNQYLKFEHSSINNYSLKHHYSSIYKKIELALFIFLSILFLTISKTNRDFTNKISYFFVDISKPIVSIAAFPFNILIELIIDFEELTNAKKQNEILVKENQEMQQKLVEIINLNYENQKLKETLKFVSSISPTYKMAKITARNKQIFGNQFFIKTLENVEIKDGSAVIANSSMIGRVIDSSKNKARILLLTDANSKIPVISSKSRIRGILTGDNSNSMYINYLPRNHDIEIGEMIFTSNDGESLPPNLLVGVVKKVNDKDVLVEMIENIANFDNVTIVEY